MIRELGLHEIAAAIGALPPAQELRVTGVGTDSRSLQPGSLFVALAGERYDAHEFVAQAVRAGAVALVVSRPVEAPVPVLLVPDTLRALARIAALHRALFEGVVVGLTGSAGKTTTKEMIAAILGTDGPVLATRGNLNNEIGVPLTLFGLVKGLRYAVVEMGAARPGDIRYLAEIVRPDIALLTNALPAHLEGFGSIDAVARTKGEIYDALGTSGVAVLNRDDAFADAWAERIGDRRVIGVSAGGRDDALVRARAVRVESGLARFVLEVPGNSIEISLGLPGAQQVANAVAATGVALALGIDLARVKHALESLVPVAGRMRARRTAQGCTLIDDTYNANPGSVRAAAVTLATYPGTRVLVMGNMAELGPQAEALHRDTGAFARAQGIEHLLATGVHAEAMASGFGAGGHACATRDALMEDCRAFDRDGVVMLVKGSRSAGMEAVVEALMETAPGFAREGVH